MPLPFDRILKIFARSQERMILFPEEVPEGVVLLSLSEYEKILPINSPVISFPDNVVKSQPITASGAPLAPSQLVPPVGERELESFTPHNPSLPKAIEDLTEEEMFAQINSTIARWEEAQKSKVSRQSAAQVPSEKILQFREDWIPSQDRVMKEEDLRDVPHQEENFHDI